MRMIFGYIAPLLILTSACGYAITRVFSLSHSVSVLESRLASTTDAFTLLRTDTDARFREMEGRAVGIADRLYEQEKRLDDFAKSVAGVDKTIGKLSGSVKTLTKLATTDQELLQKYSKVYFLNENYMPADLTTINEEYDLKNGKEVTVLSDMWPFLENLLDAAKKEGVPIMVLSGYRSFAEQASLKNAYAVRYGSGANQFSADQGYSEHQLGTAVDLTTEALGENLSGFKTSTAYPWLLAHAHEYGFVLSYPEGNSYYMFEPWHWRFVGKELAIHIHQNDIHFYDMEQRDIDAYLPELFDD